MRRLINLTLVGFALGTTHLFAANNDFIGSGTSSGLIGAIAWVVLPTLVVIGIGLGIYTWLRRNKPSLSRLFSRAKQTEMRHVSQYPPTIPSSSPVEMPYPSEGTPRAESSQGMPLPALERQSYTLESISLKELEQVLQLREAGQIREYYDAIAMIIKRYVGEKYHIKILEATTGHILEALPHNLTDSVVDHVGEILRACDMIHFSRHRPSRSELDGIYQTAREFIENQIVVPSVEPRAHEEESDENSEIHEHYRRMM